MSNPIDNNGGNRVYRPGVGGANGQQRTGQPADEAASTRRDPGVGADETQQSDRLRSLRQSIENAPDVDTSRVNDIRDRIANGDYPLDPERIASRFVEFEKLINE